MSTAVATRIFLPFVAAVESDIEERMKAALSPAEVGAWQAMHNQVRPADTARRITGGRPGARIFID